MTLDRWRGEPGFIGWLVHKWDVYQLKKFVRSVYKITGREFPPIPVALPPPPKAPPPPTRPERDPGRGF